MIVVEENMHIPRIHVASIETCGCVASFDPIEGKLTLYMTTQAPHAIRTVLALVAGHVGLSEEKIRVISPDIGGGFGGKVPIYPGYVIAVAASVLTGKPIKWIEDRSENLQADSFGRDYHMKASTLGQERRHAQGNQDQNSRGSRLHRRRGKPGQVSSRSCSISATGSYDFKQAHVEVDGVYTNKPPGGIAYRCSFRVTEAVHCIERMTDIMAHELDMDPAELRIKNFVRPEQFPFQVGPRLGI